MDGTIYAIFDPRSAKLVYLGKAQDFRRRVLQHLQRLRRGTHENRRLQALFAYLRKSNSELCFRIVNVYRDASDAERRLIADVRRRGSDLFNVSGGGDGGAGPRSQETRHRISLALTGIRKPPRTKEHIDRIAAARRGQRLSEALCAQRSEGAKLWAARGTRHYLAKLTEADIPRVRALLRLGVKQHEIAFRFGVSRSSILQIHLGRAWKHVPAEENTCLS